MKAAVLGMLAVAASGLELTPANYDEQSAGKTVFLKFFAPWCGHCKKMKPDWDTLMEEFKDSSTILVADVDCTAGGKPLCDSNGVQGFPTLKTGDPSNLEAYEGGRDLATLKAFAAGLKPKCSPSNLELCDATEKTEIEAVQALSEEELTTAIAVSDKLAADAEETFKAELEKLQATYKQLQETKDATLAEIKGSGIGLKKAVLAAKKAGASTTKEEL